MSGSRPFTTMVTTSKLGVLSRLHGMLEFDQIDSRERFADLMRASFEQCELDPKALSDDLGYSFSAVYRWIEGKTAPHPSLWPRIVSWIMTVIERKIADAAIEEPQEEVSV